MTARSVRTLPLVSAAVLAAAWLQGCTVGPNYHRPSAPIASQFKEARGWTQAHPADALDKGAWWTMFGDPVLDGLEQRIDISNQNLKAAEAAYREAHQITAEARASFFPTLSGSAEAGVSKAGGRGSSAGLGTTAGGTTIISSGSGGAVSAYTASLDASWAPDLWGKIRRTVEGDVASAQASAADIANARLSAQAELAQDYFQLRVLDEQARVYRDTVAAYQRFLQLTTNQYNAGVAARADVVSAQTQLLGAQASMIDIGTMRGQMEHAIAMLVGVAPADLTILPATLSRTVPTVPAGLPSTLLERRPDISAAERQVADANAQIGVAESAFYPDLTLSGSYGYAATNLGSLFNSANSLWSLGATVSETILDFGARRATVRAARAAYDEQVATYRQAVLTAFQNVEDELVALRVLQQEETVRSQDEAEARLAEQLALNQYKAGQVNYTTVITAQATALSASQSVLTVLQERLQASVGLVEALGGGWSTADLPKG